MPKCKRSSKEDEESSEGKIIVVTGGNNGIGKATVADLLSRKSKVTIIIACRNVQAGAKVVEELQKENVDATLKVMELDLADLDSVRKFAEEFKSQYDKLDILINNAGIHVPPSKGRETTKQGFESHFGVNHLGHFFLTNLLLDPLKKAAPSRVVTLTSSLMMDVSLDFNDLMWETRPITTIRGILNPAYSASKLANAMFSEELAKRLEGTGVHTYSVCPGLVNTDMGSNLSPILRWISPILGFFVQTPAEGCLTSVFCALSKSVAEESGQFYTKKTKRIPKYKNPPTKDDFEKLWTESERLVGLSS